LLSAFWPARPVAAALVGEAQGWRSYVVCRGGHAQRRPAVAGARPAAFLGSEAEYRLTLPLFLTGAVSDSCTDVGRTAGGPGQRILIG
jgi:hypothetical protein